MKVVLDMVPFLVLAMAMRRFVIRDCDRDAKMVVIAAQRSVPMTYARISLDRELSR